MKISIQEMKLNILAAFIFSMHFSYSQEKFNSKELGYTQGIFRVSESGALTYNLPIQVVPGTSGTQPTLSIGYNHQQGEGIMGLGWSIQGMSIISRIPRNRANDEGEDRYSLGKTLNYDNRDRFSLDGQLLVLTNDFVTTDIGKSPDTQYGSSQTTYLTEKNSFSKITLNGTEAGHPTTFTVLTKSGLIMEYGGTPDSRVQAEGTDVPVQWLVNKISDTKGNYILFSYDKDRIKGEVVPLAIHYTGNEKVGQAPFASIEFLYENMPIPSVKYIFGSKVTLSKRLKSIQSKYDNVVHRTYSFVYENKLGTEKSFLTEIHESARGVNLDPLKIHWENSTPFLNPIKEGSIFTQNTLNSYANPTKPRLAYFGDWDGDGIQDMMFHILNKDYRFPIFYKSGQKPFEKVIFNQNLGSAEEEQWKSINGTIERRYNDSPFDIPPPIQDYTDISHYLVVDFNADGKSDLIWFRPRDGLHYFYLNASDGEKIRFIQQNLNLDSFSPTIKLFFTDAYEISIRDFNNDGLPDLIFYNKKGDKSIKSHVLVTEPITYTNLIQSNTLRLTSFPDWQFLQANGWDIPIQKNDTSTVFFEDFDGDGLLDVMALDFNKDPISISQNTEGNAKLYVQRNYESYHNNTTIFTNEFDRNPYVPFALPFKSVTNSGSGIGAPTVPRRIKAFDNVLVQDFNNDGLPDVLVYGFGSNTKRFSFFINKGNFTFTDSDMEDAIHLHNQTILSELGGDDYKIYFRDVNMDGLPDIMFSNEKANLTKVAINLGGFKFQAPILDRTGFSPANLYLRGYYTSNGQHSEVLINFETGENKHRVPSVNVQANNVVTKILEVFKQYNIEYATLTDKAIYSNQVTNFKDYKYPLRKTIIPLSVVTKLEVMTNLTFRIYTYRYKGAVVDLSGRGFKGFEEVETFDLGANQTETKYFDFSKSYQEDPLVHISYSINGKPLSLYYFTSAVKSENLSKSYFNYSRNSKTIDWDADNNRKGNETTTRQTVDKYNNVLTMVTDYGDGMVDSTVNTYVNDEKKWYLGRLIKANVYKKVPGLPTQITSATFEYDAESGLLTKEVVNGDNINEQLHLTKTYKHDYFGNIIESTIRGWNGTDWEERVSKTEMDRLGRFIIKSTNPEGHVTLRQYDEATGNVRKITDANGLVTTLEYDALGRKRKEILPDGNWNTQDFYYHDERLFGTPYECGTNCTNTGFPKPYISFVIYKQSSVTPAVIEYYDELGRHIGTKTKSFSGQSINSYKLHSPVNDVEISAEYEPFFEGDSPPLTQYIYDDQKRLIEKRMPNGSTEKIEYKENQMVYINALGHRKTVDRNNKGLITQVTDNLGNILSYEYDSNNNLLRTKDPKGNIIENEYNSSGLKIRMTDPDMGTYLYSYNGFGELIEQKNPDGNSLKIQYDKLGRIIKQTEKEGITEWKYDRSETGAANGKIVSISYSVGNIKTEFEYDHLQRHIKEKKSIESKEYTSTFTYNSKGLPDTYTYPSGYKIRYSYNTDNFLISIIQSSDDKTIWRAKEYDASGRLTLEEYGNNILTEHVFEYGSNNLLRINASQGSQFLSHFKYEYDKAGNLLSREDLVKTKKERFLYDNLNRLVQTEVIGGAKVSISYDVLGNIISKSDVGTYEYGSSNKGPHQVISITPDQQTSTPVCVPSFEVSTTFNSFNKVSRVQNDTSYVDILYDGSKQKIMQKMYVQGNLVRTKIFVNSTYEVEKTLSGTREIHYLRGSEGVIGTHTLNSAGSSKVEYWHKDNLGSLTAITDAQGNVTREFSFDAWGKRRNSDWSVASGNPQINPENTRGFTSHEHYDLFDLVDMNGRIYDPIIGRFLSPDPFIQDISDLQSFNRYSYVLNNPVTFIDPSGFFSIGKISFPNPFNSVKDIFKVVTAPLLGVVAFSDWVWEKGTKWVKENWKTVVIITISVAAVYLTGGIATGFIGGVVSGAIGGFAGGFSGTLLNGGNLGDAFLAGGRGALIGAASAGLTYGVGSAAQALNTYGTRISVAGYPVKILGHGAVQGGMRKLQGGKFSHGFIAGAVSGGFEPVNASVGSEFGRVTAAAALGGVTSVINGDKFANGAITGSYVYLFNSRLHDFISDAKDAFETLKGDVAPIAERLGSKVLEKYEDGKIAYESLKRSAYTAQFVKGGMKVIGGAMLIGGGGPVGVVLGTAVIFESGKQMFNSYQNTMKTVDVQIDIINNHFNRALDDR